MAEYEERERAFNASLPGIFSRYGKSLVIADAEGKMQYLQFVQAVFAQDNFTVEQKISILNSQNPLTIGLSIPAASVVDMSPFGMDEAKLKMSMTIHASDVSAQTLDSESEAEGTGSIGWGPFKASVRVKASVSTHSERKRSSDYTATTDAELTMRRQNTPEALSKIMDMFSEVTQDAMKINQEIITSQGEAASNEVATQGGGVG